MAGHSLLGVSAYLIESQSVSQEAVDEDREEELESLNAALEIDTLRAQATQPPTSDPNAGTTRTFHLPEPASKHPEVSHGELHERMRVASQNVVVTRTLEEYARLWRQFTQFCIELKFVDSGSALDQVDSTADKTTNLPKDLPSWIAIWIMHKCDETDIFTGKPKHPSVPRATYGTAQKMRAAMSHKFARDFGLGAQQWIESPVTPGKFLGNPSLSVVVSQYMISLRRRKVRAGEVVTSARAIDEGTVKAMWEFNMNFSQTEYGHLSKKTKAKHPEMWAGYNVRVMLHCLYVTSMLCLLRYDEALRIMWSDVHFETIPHEAGQRQQRRLRLMLPFRKTHQNGGIAPFVLYCNRKKPWLCPLRAFALWWKLSGLMQIPREGYVFRKKIGHNGISANPYEAMSTDAFIECFRNNLLDIDIDPRPYGTHSFRRGGCQHLAMVLRWPFRNICTWGGWSPNFDNPGTIFKYLLSWTDTPLLEREDYFDPDRAGTDPCNACGRTCTCA